MAFALGRLHVPDERDAAFPMSLHLDTVPGPVPSKRLWNSGPVVLDQGQVGACVGFTGADWMQCEPIQDAVTNQTGLDLYHACKAIDGMPDLEGTYDRALMKVLVAQGRVDRYLWAQSPAELQKWILTTGPVMVGTNWYDQMFTPDASGVVRRGGKVAGGHEYLVIGSAGRYYRCRNSWGPSWGLNGEFLISHATLHRLVFKEGGDACAAVEK